jgi:hypothetical protein
MGTLDAYYVSRNGGVAPGGNCLRIGCEVALTCATAALMSAPGWKKTLMLARPSIDAD